MTETIEEMLIRHEGLRFTPYRCTAEKLTIGVGRNLDDKGISKDEAMLMFYNDLEECERDLSNKVFKGRFFEFPGPVQGVLINMRFQHGPGGFRRYRKMIAAFKHFDYEKAILEMIDSNWYRDKFTQDRAKELIEIVRSEIK